MTTLNSATDKNPASKIAAGIGCIKPLRLSLLISLAAFALAGCESASNILGGGDSTAPQAALTAPPLAASNAQLAKLEIAPVIGAPDNISRDLQTQLTSSFDRSKISVAHAPGGKGEYVLRGYIVAAREKTGSKISYIWDVTDQTGKRANRITGEEFAAGAGKDPWSAVTPQIVQSIADKTAAQIASWLPGSSGSIPVASAAPAMTPGAAAATPVATAAAVTSTQAQQKVAMATPAVATSTTPAATPVALTVPSSGPTTGSIDSNAPIITTVPNVTGAPGDGGATLTTAIQRELTKNGVALTPTPAGPAYKVEGKVAMGQGKDGKQPIQIDWNVIDPTGKKLGTVSQKNEVPQGSLDGAWGKTADAAAAAAAQGILKLLPQQKTN